MPSVALVHGPQQQRESGTRQVTGETQYPLRGFGGTLGAILNDIDQPEGGVLISLPPRPLEPREPSGPSWGALGAFQGAGGAVLEISGFLLGTPGALLVHLGAIVKPRKAVASEMGGICIGF